MSGKFPSDVVPNGAKVKTCGLNTKNYNGLDATVTASYVDKLNVLYYTMDCANLTKTFDIKRENFKVLELPASPAPAPAPAHADSFDEEDFVDETECECCSKCEYCIDNTIQTDKGPEICGHNCNCHFSKRQLSEWYSAAVDDNTALVEANKEFFQANEAFFQANTELVANNKALVKANLALQKKIAELESLLKKATTK